MKNNEEFKALVLKKEEAYKKEKKNKRTRIAAITVPLVICAAATGVWLDRSNPKYAADSVAPPDRTAQAVSPFVPMTVVITKNSSKETTVLTKEEHLYAVEECFADVEKYTAPIEPEKGAGENSQKFSVVITYKNGTICCYDCNENIIQNKADNCYYKMSDSSYERLQKIISEN